MKIRIEFTNNDKENLVSHARDLDLEEGFAEKVEAVANQNHRTVLKRLTAEYNAEQNFIEINVSQILMNKIADFIGKICKQFKPMMAVVKAFVASVEEDLEEIKEEADSEEETSEIQTEFDC